MSIKMTPAIREKLLAKGFKRLGPGWYVKLHRKDDVQLGTAVLFSDAGAVCLRSACPIIEALQETLAKEVPRMQQVGYALGYDDFDDEDDDDDDDDEVGAGRGAHRRARRRGRRARRVDRRVSRRDKSKFRQRVNKAAGKLARGKVMRKLRDLKVKVLQSPLAKAGMNVAAKALQAYGVPPAVTKMALNTAREAGIDRAKKGGWSGMVQRATEKGARPGTALREGFRRQRSAVRDAFGDVTRSFADSANSDSNVTKPRTGKRFSKMRRAYTVGCDLAEETAHG